MRQTKRFTDNKFQKLSKQGRGCDQGETQSTTDKLKQARNVGVTEFTSTTELVAFHKRKRIFLTTEDPD